MSNWYSVDSWVRGTLDIWMFHPSRHGCISDAFLRRLMQRIRDISKRADLQISETSPMRCIKDVFSETSLRSLRSSQRHLWVASESVIRYFQTEAFFWLPVDLLACLQIFCHSNIKSFSELGLRHKFIWLSI